MKYSERYKDLQVNEITDAVIMKSDHCEPCACCGEMTDYIDTCFEVYVCSDKCANLILMTMLTLTVEKSRGKKHGNNV